MGLNLAIIPARGGSKRIPRKNIKPFHGRPIITYSIKAAIDSKVFDEVMVSTDDEEIASVAREAGASVPFMRSANNADDFATTMDVLFEVVGKYRDQGKAVERFCCVYPAAPFVTADVLRKADKKFREAGTDFLMPVVRYGFPIQRALHLKDNLVEMIAPENYNKRSQDLEPAYHDCGQFYFGKADKISHHGSFFDGSCAYLERNESEVQDIDSGMDWKLAEIKFSLLKSSNFQE